MELWRLERAYRRVVNRFSGGRIGSLASALGAGHRSSHYIRVERLLDRLRRLGLQRDDHLLVHSSFRSALYGSHVKEKTPLEAGDYARSLILGLKDHLSSGSLLMPTDFLRGLAMMSLEGREVDFRAAGSRRGFLTSEFLKMSGVKRSLHPIYNISALGGHFDAAIARHHEAPFAMQAGTPWSDFSAAGGKILFLGVDLEANSLIHLPEYRLGLAYPRPVFFHRPHVFKVRTDDNETMPVSGYMHAIQWKSDTVTKFMTYMNGKSRFFVEDSVDDCRVILVDAAKMNSLLIDELNNNTSWYDAVGWA